MIEEKGGALLSDSPCCRAKRAPKRAHVAILHFFLFIYFLLLFFSYISFSLSGAHCQRQLVPGKLHFYLCSSFAAQTSPDHPKSFMAGFINLFEHNEQCGLTKIASVMKHILQVDLPATNVKL